MPFALLRSLAFATLAVISTSGLFAQSASTPPAAPKVSFPAASPAATLKQRVGLTDIEVIYARPSMKGRKIFGGLLPYGEVWRTGANSATKITFSTPVKIGGQELPAGSYALYSIPGANEWTVMFSKVTGEWGAYSYKEENDAVRLEVAPVSLPEPVETFTIEFNDLRTDSATLTLAWEKTRVPVKLEFDVIPRVVADIDAAMSSGAKLAPGVYYNAAMFYYDNGLDLQKARGWIEEATKTEKPPFFMLHGKAKILAKLGDKDGAIAAARQSIAAASGSAQAEYIRLNEALIASLR